MGIGELLLLAMVTWGLVAYCLTESYDSPGPRRPGASSSSPSVS